MFVTVFVACVFVVYVFVCFLSVVCYVSFHSQSSRQLPCTCIALNRKKHLALDFLA